MNILFDANYLLRSFFARFWMFAFSAGTGFGAMAAISVSIVTPGELAKVDTAMPVIVTIRSDYEIASVTGAVAGKVVTFAYSSTATGGKFPAPGWTATVDLTGVGRGAHTLVVSAVDALGAAADASRTVTLDAKPTISVRKPAPYAVAAPSIDLDIACIDDVAGCVLSVRDMAGVEVLTGSDSVSARLLLDKYVGQTTLLTVSATDVGGQKTIRTLSIPVVDASRLVFQAGVPGRIFDSNADRILYLDDTVEPQQLKIRDRTTGADATIFAVPGSRPKEGYLHLSGAMFVDQPGRLSTTKLYDWRGGALVDLSSSYQSTGGFMVKGKYATFFNAGAGYPSSPDYFLRDLSTGVNRLIDTGVGNNTNSLTADGAVAYWKGYDIYLWKNGVSSRITYGDGLPYNVFPATDGVNVVFLQGSNKIVLWNGAALTTLADAGVGYAIANGYVAFTKRGATGQLQVWRRSPDGALEQLTFFATDSRIDTLSDAGAVTLSNGGKFYVHEVGGALVELSAGVGKRFWQNGDLFGVIGGAIFKMDRRGASSPLSTTTSTSTTTTTATPAQTSTTVSSTSTTTLTGSATGSSSLVLALEPGWNLLGNTLNRAISVATLFGDASVVTTVWTWDAVGSLWRFYTPMFDAVTLETFAKGKGYGALSAIQPGEGFWINAKSQADLGSVLGQPHSLAAQTITPGWNLVATADKIAPTAFNLILTDPFAPPPAVGVVPINFITLWAWDNPQSKWFFYSPSLDGQGGRVLVDYISGKGYLDFVGGNKTLGAGVGFWVNKP